MGLFCVFVLQIITSLWSKIFGTLNNISREIFLCCLNHHLINKSLFVVAGVLNTNNNISVDIVSTETSSLLFNIKEKIVIQSIIDREGDRIWRLVLISNCLFVNVI